MSKKIKTGEELEKLLQDDLAWRKKEMISLRILILKDTINEAILLRSSMALLCAHFEGFIKYAANKYVSYVSDQRIPNKLLKNNFVVFKLKEELKQCKNTDKNSVHQRLILKYEKLSYSNFEVKSDMISTHSNPSSEVIKEILCSVGIETDIFDLKKQYIDTELLSNRHKVVHGERYGIKKEDFQTTFDIIMDLLDDFNRVIICAADTKKYMKGST